MFRTKEQLKNLCTDCPVARTANLIGDTWSLMIIRDLCTGKKRFGELSTSLEGVSSRTLTKKLIFLEENQIIERKKYSEVPPRVEYSLTKKGEELNIIIENLRSFGKKHEK